MNTVLNQYNYQIFSVKKTQETLGNKSEQDFSLKTLRV